MRRGQRVLKGENRERGVKEIDRALENLRELENAMVLLRVGAGGFEPVPANGRERKGDLRPR